MKSRQLCKHKLLMDRVHHVNGLDVVHIATGVQYIRARLPVGNRMRQFSFLYLSSSQDSVHCTLSVTVCMCTPCQRASSTSKTDSFLWGHGPDTLACKARPSFDGCGTSLSVSLSLSLQRRDLDAQRPNLASASDLLGNDVLLNCSQLNSSCLEPTVRHCDTSVTGCTIAEGAVAGDGDC